MSSQKRIKASSVAAFLFMPQFHLSTRQMAYLVPVFMRTLALILSQANLIPQNHPSLMYGIEGVRKYSFSELMGEAWYRLRHGNSNATQWGIFGSIVLMIGFMIASIATFFGTVVFGFGTQAHAQLFDHPLGATDSSTVPAQVGMFDKNFPAATSAQGDYGIALLDKVLRAGANGVGGPLQNATQGLMQLYNSGVLVVASVMLFWSIMSVVVDTAKTGTIGGGRHNMVWAPMRIVFALGLLIPLGTAGFSSGQFMVMKLAEWGSNLGTRAWSTYITGVTADSHMLASLSNQNPTSFVHEYNKMWLCRVAFNGAAHEVGQLNGDTEVKSVAKGGIYDTGGRSVAFTNTISSNLCGTVTYGTMKDPSSLIASSVDPALGTALHNFRTGMIAAYDSAVAALDTPAKAVACQYAGEFIYDLAAPANNPLITSNTCTAVEIGTQADGVYGSHADVNTMINGFATSIQAALDAQRTLLENNFITQPAFMNDMINRGWAGMGMWYHRISQMNRAVQDYQFATVSIVGGDYEQSLAMSAQVDPAKMYSSHAEKLITVMNSYEKWWKMGADAVVVGAAPVPTGKSAAATTPSNQTKSGSDTSIMGLAKALSGDGTSAWNALSDYVMQDTEYFIFDIVEKDDPNIYPLAELAATGNQIIYTGVGILATLTVLPTLVAAIPVIGGGIANVLVNGPLPEFIGSIAMTIVLAGIALAYYVPIIPFIKTAFSVLTWIISVFEAVMMVPIAALAHLTTEGDGLAAGARSAWILWLNILLRPVLTVLGFVGALLIFNTFAVYFNDTFAGALTSGASKDGFMSIFNTLVYTIVYVGVLYTAANTTFKMLDLIPNAMMRWMPGGSADSSFDDNSAEGFISSAGRLAANSGSSMGRGLGAAGGKLRSGIANRGGQQGAGNATPQTSYIPK